jgi:hypothetical protein
MTALPPWSRRRFLVAGGALALSACSVHPVAKRATEPAPEVPTDLLTAWDAKPDGPLPTAGDEGRPLLVRQSGTTAAPSIRDGGLVGNIPRTGAGAVYVLQDHGARVNRIGARFAFVDGDTSGSVGLLAFGAGADHAGHCHLAFAPDRWIAGVISDGRVVEIARQEYTSPVPRDGAVVTADVRFSGATAWITAPDGTVSSLTDTRFRRPSGSLACWEFYKGTPSGADVRFLETWAG